MKFNKNYIDQTMKTIYDKLKDKEDGFLYLTYSD